MKRIALSILLASSMLATVAEAQSSSTPIIGYYKIGVKAGTTAWVSGFVAKKDFQGAATSIASAANSTITQTGAGWTPGAFNLHYVEILTGTNAGLILDIVSNTASQVVVRGATAAFGVTGTPTYAIRKHATFNTLFPGGGGLSTFSDLISLENSNGTQTVALYNGLNWEDAITPGVNMNNTIVYPGQGISIIASADAQVTFGGNQISYVKTGPTRIPLYVDGVNYVGSVNPLVATAPADPIFSTLGVTTALNYGLKDSLSPFTDLAAVFSIDGNFDNTDVLFSNGTNVIDGVGGVAVRDTLPIRNGTAIQIIPAADVPAFLLPQTFTSN